MKQVAIIECTRRLAGTVDARTRYNVSKIQSESRLEPVLQEIQTDDLGH